MGLQVLTVNYTKVDYFKKVFLLAFPYCSLRKATIVTIIMCSHTAGDVFRNQSGGWNMLNPRATLSHVSSLHVGYIFGKERNALSLRAISNIFYTFCEIRKLIKQV